MSYSCRLHPTSLTYPPYNFLLGINIELAHESKTTITANLSKDPISTIQSSNDERVMRQLEMKLFQ